MDKRRSITASDEEKIKQRLSSSKGKTSTLSTASAAQPETATRRRPPVDLRIVQSFLLIWVDSSIDESNDDYRNSITQLRRIVNIIHTFTDADQCVDFLTEVQWEKAFMIVSGSLGQRLVPIIHDVSQLDSIYVFCEEKSMHEKWVNEWSKVKGIFTQISTICESLKHAARQCDQNSISISIVPPCDALNRNLDELEQSFMYTQLIKEILLEIDYNEQSISDFADYCRYQYSDNDRELNTIDAFEQEYHRQSPIWWYTYKYFIYYMLNRALRTQELDTIIKIGFFIRDLHRHIEQLHSDQASDHERASFTVYRGQGLSKVDFNKMKESQGGLLSFNNFLSTSIDRDVSFLFADSNQYREDLIGILFQMTIDPSNSSIPFADIGNVSNYTSEKEILFSMHTVFRIGEIKQIDGNDRLWEVELKLTSDNDEQLSALTKRMRYEIQGTTGWHRMGKLLIKLGEFDQAEHVYGVLLDLTSDDAERVLFYNELGCIKDGQGDYVEAISFYGKSLEIHQKSLPPNHLDLATSYNNIGSAYLSMGEYSKALSSYKKALEIYQNSFSPNHPSLATSYNNIGVVCIKMGEYSKAVSSYEKALEIQQKSLPINHPSLATSYNNIGMLYMNMGEYSKALSYHKKALEIRQKSLPPNHPDLAISYNNIGSVYHNIGEYSKALSAYEKALEIGQKSLHPNHPDLATSYNDIGSVYDDMGEYSKALSFYEKSLEIYQNSLPPNHPWLATSYDSIGLVYDNIGDHSKALSLYEKSLEIRQISLPPNHPVLGTSYNNIGSTYWDMGEYSKALSSHEKALEIREKSLLPNHPDLATSYSNIGAVRMTMGDYSKALLSYEKALEIYQKSLPSNHPNLATSYNNIGTVYMNMGDYSKALSSHEKALEIRQKSLPINHPSLATSYNNIGLVYKNMGEYSKALSSYEKALEIRQISLPPNHPVLGTSYNNIGGVYVTMGEYSKALSFYEKDLEIIQKSLPPNHPDLATSYNNIGTGYYNLGEFSTALSFFERALNSGQRSLSPTHPLLQLFRKNIEGVRKKL